VPGAVPQLAVGVGVRSRPAICASS
jgi:hypothetical protein